MRNWTRHCELLNIPSRMRSIDKVGLNPLIFILVRHIPTVLIQVSASTNRSLAMAAPRAAWPTVQSLS